MKLRFEVDPTACERVMTMMDAAGRGPPRRRTLHHVYLDTPDRALACHGFFLRFERRRTIGADGTENQTWSRRVIRSKRARGLSSSIKKLGIPELKRRLDAAFNVRIERCTWNGAFCGGSLSLDRTRVSTGRAADEYAELRLECRRKHADAATRYAVELGAMQLSSRRARDRGWALLDGDGR